MGPVGFYFWSYSKWNPLFPRRSLNLGVAGIPGASAHLVTPSNILQTDLTIHKAVTLNLILDMEEATEEATEEAMEVAMVVAMEAANMASPGSPNHPSPR